VHRLTLNIGLSVEIGSGSSLFGSGAVSSYGFGLVLSCLLLSINGGVPSTPIAAKITKSFFMIVLV
jgi:hypothetical protein